MASKTTPMSCCCAVLCSRFWWGVLVLQANQFTLSPFIDNRCNTFNVDDMLRCDVSFFE